MSVILLHRLHFNSTPFLRIMAISCPQWQRTSEEKSEVEQKDLVVFIFNLVIFNENDYEFQIN